MAQNQSSSASLQAPYSVHTLNRVLQSRVGSMKVTQCRACYPKFRIGIENCFDLPCSVEHELPSRSCTKHTDLDIYSLHGKPSIYHLFFQIIQCRKTSQAFSFWRMMNGTVFQNTTIDGFGFQTFGRKMMLNASNISKLLLKLL